MSGHPSESSARTTGARVALATSTERRRGSPDDVELASALAAQGLRPDLAAWDDDRVRWDRYEIVVVRSTWNYHRQRDRFLRWVGRVSAASTLWNPAPTLRWNTDKRYLAELEKRGVPVVPTVYFPRGEVPDLSRLFRAHGWMRVVVKPTISANAWRTFIVARGPSLPLQRAVARTAREMATMVQPYQASVETVGERSLVFLDGEFSHAVRREPVLLGRRGPRILPTVRASPSQLELARLALSRCPKPTLYARVDILRGSRGAWQVGEVELTEPFLYLASSPGAAERLALAIKRRVDEAG